ncbi:uncharacterized protein LOC115455254 isoform X2 [Manduca sexta]|uniref:uncharacterized protein LOC115455254 isoform X2 n=1 Tax=Manduca sexta TaxID=7130 RepID=UPI00188F4577|nr:uncharacterized protein LOC115455254 isoform X2 [Manduca sexta]
MYSENCWGNRGEHIIPSARKSIHSHTSCPFGGSESVMGKYGIEKRNIQQKAPIFPTDLDLGEDVVDNAQSKYAQALSAVQFAPRKIERRHSSNSESDISEDDCDETQTGESESQNLTDHSQYQSFGSNQCLSNKNRHLREYNNDEVELPTRSVIYEYQNESNCFRDAQINLSNYIGKICAILIIPIMGILAYCLRDSLPVMQDTNVSTSAHIYDRLKFYNDMTDIGKTYKLNQDTILELQVGIYSISEKQDTDSFIFLYNSEKQNFNSNAFNEFINQIASISARYLRNESVSVRHTVIDTVSLKVKDTDELIHKYSDDITRGGVMVMRKLEMLPSSLAMALHYYCDVYNPLVKKSAIFFTLDIANCPGKMSTHSDIEKCLKRKWNTVSNEFIGPLLARVVSVVVDVTYLF